MIVLGINAYHPDAAIALFQDGELLWAGEEERYNRIKHASGFPTEALRACCRELKLDPNRINVVAISKDPKANMWRKIAFVMKHRPKAALLGDRFKALKKSSKFEEDFFQAFDNAVTSSPKFIHVEHHRAHVASSFFVSPFKEAAFLSFDGLGDFSSAMWGKGEENQLQIMDRIFFPHSVGFLYTAGTQFCGFPYFGDEYKLMGLAAYGQPKYAEQLEKMVMFKSEGKYELNLDYFIHHLGQAKVRWEGGLPEQDILFSDKWKEDFGEPRDPKTKMTQHYMDIAASLQKLTEKIYFHILNHLYEKTQCESLCLAGGCVYNSVANGKITKNTPFKQLYIQPAAGDSGTAIGAAAYAYHSILNKPRKFVMNHAYYGTQTPVDDIEEQLKSASLKFEKLNDDEIITRTAQAISEGKVIGWFQGAMEFGPRALGNRSILADPRRHDMKDILNERIKLRETFRPFAPAIPEEKVLEYFELDEPTSPFMLKVCPVREEKKEGLPAITHVDGSARVQTVSEKTNPRFWKLLNKYETITGIPIIINTSFNENEPVVCSADHAIACFQKTKMDVLVLGPYYLTKES